MDKAEEYLLDALRCAIHGASVGWVEPLDAPTRAELLRLARQHRILPLIMQATYDSPALGSNRVRNTWTLAARRDTIAQARRTAEFLLLYGELNRRGLHPTVMKGIVLRDMYPEPEQRPSVDEDFLVTEAEFFPLHHALTACGLHVVETGESLDDADEVSYRDDNCSLYLEVHRHLFSTDSAAYGDCNAPFEGALERTVTVQAAGATLRTLSPTDHVLFLICHAYKHFLHAGVGIRQLCDISLFASRYNAQIDWLQVTSACRRLHIDRFAAALFHIGEAYLDLAAPIPFSGCQDDVRPLLEDVLSGGLYGVEDINRAHSSNMTLDAIAASKSGKRRGGVLRSVFLPARSLAGRYPYLRRFPVLLPVAWGQRVSNYLFRQKHIDPAASVRIGNERIALFREYGLMD